jgi:subtilisin
MSDAPAYEPVFADRDLTTLQAALRRKGLVMRTSGPAPDDAPVVQVANQIHGLFWRTGCFRLKPDVSPQVLRDLGVTILKQLHFAPNLFYAKGRDVGHLPAVAFQLENQIVYFEPERQFTMPPRGRVLGEDPRAIEQPYLDSMRIRMAWNTSRGQGVTLGIIDDEFDPRSKELAPNWDWSRSAFLTTDTAEGPVFRTASRVEEYPSGGDSDHGTACASLAAASANGMNGIGVAPACQLLAIATDNVVSSIMAARALAYCADPSTESDGRQRPGCRVISCSTADTLIQTDSRVVRDALDFLVTRDVLLVSAVSNSEPEIAGDYVSTHRCAIATASVNENHERPRTGARGPGLGCVAETMGIYGSTSNDQWKFLGAGNSWSAPVVAGIAVLLRAAHPRETATQIKERILTTCDPLGDPNEFGRGLVRADLAIQ